MDGWMDGRCWSLGVSVKGSVGDLDLVLGWSLRRRIVVLRYGGGAWLSSSGSRLCCVAYIGDT